jgi:nucleotide-binding universal stress UspA family protein
MFKHILVPLDDSEAGERALAAAQALAQVGGSHVTLLHAVSMLNPAYTALPYPLSIEVYGEMVEAETHKAEIYLKGIEERLRKCGLEQVKVKVVDGEAGAVITEVAQEVGADLIVMSTHGRTGIARAVLGSVADAVVRHGSVPVLLVSHHQPTPVFDCRLSISRILVPLDGSEQAAQALVIAAVLASAEDAEVVLLNAMPQTVLTGEELATPNPIWAQRVLSDAARKALPAGVRHEVVATSGAAAEAIVREAVERECDLIVMTTHGRSGFARLRLGSVAAQVLAHAPMPLLLLHAQGEPGQVSDLGEATNVTYCQPRTYL